MLERFRSVLGRFAGRPMSARSADELAQRRELQEMYSVRHAMGGLPRGDEARPAILVYTALNRRGVAVWLAA